MTIQEAYQEGEKRLFKAEIQDARLDAWYLMEHITGLSRAIYYAEPTRELTEEQLQQYFIYIEKRQTHIPLQHLTGVQEFMGLSFQVNEHVLIPRQDTETVVEEALKVIRSYALDIEREQDKRKYKILDMCTGSGCILLSTLHYARKDSNMLLSGIGTDISEKALEIARTNAEVLSIEANFEYSDLFENIAGVFQMIISNPPYIRTSVIETLQEEVKNYDPVIALDGKEDGLYFYRQITRESVKYLEKGGSLIFEIGCDQGNDVQAIMQEAGYRNVMVKKDLAGLDRVVIGVYDR